MYSVVIEPMTLLVPHVLYQLSYRNTLVTSLFSTINKYMLVYHQPVFLQTEQVFCISASYFQSRTKVWDGNN